MKITGIFFTLLLFTLPILAAEKKIKSKITDVTVFITGAQVTRSASVNLPKGKSVLVFTQITSLLKKESLEVTGNGNFTILSVNHKLEYDYSEPSIEKVNRLKKQLKSKQLKIQELRTHMRVYKKERQLVESIISLNSKADSLDIIALRTAQRYYHDEINSINLTELQYQRKIDTLNDQYNKIKGELESLKIRKQNPRSEIRVVVSAKRDLKAKFNLSYYVLNARWYPEYNIRVKDVDSPLKLDYKAKITQQTGEDWNNVKLTLSTSEPNKTSQKPKLTPWNLRLNQRTRNRNNRNNYNRYTGAELGAVKGKVIDEYGDPIPFASIQVVGSTIGTTSDFDGNFNLTLPKGSKQLRVSLVGFKNVVQPINSNFLQIVMAENVQQLSELNVRGARSDAKYYYIDGKKIKNQAVSVNSISKSSTRRVRKKKFNAIKNNYNVVHQHLNVVDVNFKVKEKYSILSSVENQTIHINSIEMPVKYQYYCAPKLDKDVFLTAQIDNWEKYNLLEGKTTIFYEGTYVGTSVMNVRYVADTLDISLGRDKNIQVSRQKTKDYKRKEVLGSDIIEERRWNISVKNNKSQSVNIIVEDQIPVTTDKRIQVKHEETDKAVTNDKTGIITWNLKVKKEKLKDIQFKYTVSYPNGNMVQLE